MAEQQKQFEDKVVASLREISNRDEPVDKEFLQQVVAFLDEQKPKLDHMQHQLHMLKSKPTN